MTETVSGASASSAVVRSMRCRPEECHSNVAVPPPGQGFPFGHRASRVHAPTSGWSLPGASSAGGCPLDQLLYRHSLFTPCCREREELLPAGGIVPQEAVHSGRNGVRPDRT